MAAPVSAPQFLPFLLFLLFSIALLPGPADAAAAAAVAASLRPEPALQGMKSVMIDEAKRRRLSNFRICALCTCCGGPRGLCLPSPCCYTINCNIPNRPFGFCSFTPRTCNCFGCHL